MASVEEQLKRTQVELANIKEDYQEFVYLVSHDLRAPLRRIGGFAGIIAKNHKDDFDDKTTKHFDFIIKGAQEGQDIMDSLLVLSRINTRNQPFIEVDCNQLASNTKAVLANLISATNAQIEVGNLPTISVDKQQFSQVFHHLLKNALIYHTEGTQPRVTISAEEKGRYWQICVKDNGIGIRSKNIGNLFKAFNRAVGDEYPGIGMGLAIAKKIVQRHRGEIWVESEEGAGAAFYFTIGKIPQ